MVLDYSGFNKGQLAAALDFYNIHRGSSSSHRARKYIEKLKANDITLAMVAKAVETLAPPGGNSGAPAQAGAAITTQESRALDDITATIEKPAPENGGAVTRRAATSAKIIAADDRERDRRPPPYYREFPGDMMSQEGVRALSLVEVGLLNLMRWNCWRNNGVPRDPDQLAMILGKPLDDVTRALTARVLALFEPIDGEPGRLHDLELTKQRLAMIDKHEERSRSGRLGALETWGKRNGSAKGSAIGSANGSLNRSEGEGGGVVLEKGGAGGKAADSPRITFEAGTSKFTGITDQDMVAWQSAYPGIAIPLELERATLWLKARDGKHQNANDEAFLSSWFARANNNGGTDGKKPGR